MSAICNSLDGSQKRASVRIAAIVPHETSPNEFARDAGLGDLTLLELLSPSNSGNWVLGAGPTAIFPTATSHFTGQGKWQLGPSVVVGYLTKQYFIGVFPQQWWSIGGEHGRGRVGKREDVGRVVLAAVVTVERQSFVVVDDADRDLGGGHRERGADPARDGGAREDAAVAAVGELQREAQARCAGVRHMDQSERTSSRHCALCSRS